MILSFCLFYIRLQGNGDLRQHPGLKMCLGWIIMFFIFPEWTQSSRLPVSLGLTILLREFLPSIDKTLNWQIKEHFKTLYKCTIETFLLTLKDFNLLNKYILCWTCFMKDYVFISNLSWWSKTVLFVTSQIWVKQACRLSTLKQGWRNVIRVAKSKPLKKQTQVLHMVKYAVSIHVFL